jgi:signal transduction histidine kinase
LESGQVKLNISNLRLNEILQTALQSTQQSIANSNALLEFDVNFTNTKIQTDPDRLSQVFINLITNAVKYNDKSQPTLKISCKKNNEFLCVSFQDNGPGIPEAEHTIIFEKFTRLSNTENTSGIGLGLAISQEIMKNLGGSLICLESKTGANFEVKIPLN